jgi:hypothetical protein
MSADGWPIDQASIAAIAAMPQSGNRNRLVTQTYHQLALAIGELTGGPEANWFHFGTWASNTAGRIMTGATLPPMMRRILVGKGDLLGDGEHRVGLIDRLEDTGVIISVGLSTGNITVFAEIAAAGAAFVTAHAGATDADRAAGHADLARIVAGAAPVFGQSRLARGLEAYEAALVEPDPSRRAQLMLAGTVDMGAVEQSKLDPYVSAVMCAAVTAAFTPFADRFDRSLVGRVDALGRLGRRVATAADHAWDRLMTRYFMVFEGPNERLRLGHDVPPLSGQALIAPVFERPSEPELLDVFREFDRTDFTGSGDATVDWSDLRDRMGWICWFFLSRHFDGRLAQPPFSPPEVQQLRALVPV